MSKIELNDALNGIINAKIGVNKANEVMRTALKTYMKENYPNLEEGCFGIISKKDKEVVSCFYVSKYDYVQEIDIELDCDPQRDMTLIFID